VGQGVKVWLKFNRNVFEEFEAFYKRSDTFSLGVCNGCQLMTLLGLVPGEKLPDTSQPRFIHNQSGRFESRFLTVKIMHSPAVMLQGMEGSILGIWAAHGEGRVHFPDESVLDRVLRKNLAPARYVDDHQIITEAYPYNPNGSVHGIAAVCSEDGRHLAIMPHPERSILQWQWPYYPPEYRSSHQVAPWLAMFQNAHRFCVQTKSAR